MISGAGATDCASVVHIRKILSVWESGPHFTRTRFTVCVKRFGADPAFYTGFAEYIRPDAAIVMSGVRVP